MITVWHDGCTLFHIHRIPQDLLGLGPVSLPHSYIIDADRVLGFVYQEREELLDNLDCRGEELPPIPVWEDDCACFHVHGPPKDLIVEGTVIILRLELLNTGQVFGLFQNGRE